MVSILFVSVKGNAQQIMVTGRILEFRQQKGLKGIHVWIDGDKEGTYTDDLGDFRLYFNSKGNVQLKISAPNYLTQSYPLLIGSENIHLGPIFLKRDLELEKNDNLVTLTEADLLDDANRESNSGLLRSTRDVFLNRAAFDFSQAFFRLRGYDSKEGIVLINGIPLNRIWDGRPQWNNWGGLNDVTRNQEFTFGLEPSDHSFGGLLGSNSIDMSPQNARPGLRLSTATSNRTYRNRLMATYHSGKDKKGFAYSLSASRRWAEKGFVDGTSYDAYSLFLAASLALSPEQTIGISVIDAFNSRGRSSALTEEVAGLMGPKYNPYWGMQGGSVRTSRIRTIHEPLVLFTYDFTKDDLRFRTSLAYQWGDTSYTRVGYFNAPNPDPTYYRYMPSYYLNSPIGANYISAKEAKNSFLASPQWPWRELYEANLTSTRENDAAYAYYEDMNEENTFKANAILNLPLGKSYKVDAGFTLQRSERQSFARVKDLLGAKSLRDVDPFTNTRNDLQGMMQKGIDEIFGYNYRIDTYHWTSFLQARFFWKQCEFYVAGEYAEKSFQRDGLFKNERFIDDSFGKGEKAHLKSLGFKGGISYAITSRHWIKANAYSARRPPPLKYIYINPRENHNRVPGNSTEFIQSIDLSYLIRLSDLKGRLSSYYTRFQNGTEVNFFYVDSGFGSYFVQEVVTGLDTLLKGLEMGVEYQISPTTKVSLVGSVGRYEYASDPSVSINFDTSAENGELQKTEGRIDLGQAAIKGIRLAQGPQTALSIGLEYRDPTYWWVGTTANYLADNHIDIAYIKRTPSFRIDPDTGSPFPEATEENLGKLLNQESLPSVYLLNMVGGKSWLHKGKYISAFLSINNVFNTIFKSGGYEQSRNGNYGQMARDNLSGSPSFGTKYWYGFGRTFFLNLAISF